MHIKVVPLLCSLLIASPITVSADNGHRLWLSHFSATTGQDKVITRIDTNMPDDDGFRITPVGDSTLITARRPIGLLYGRYELLRSGNVAHESHPQFALRMLNHWDNLNGSIERGYAGKSIFHWFHLDSTLICQYAEANASIGINGTVLNNVNASPKILTHKYLKEVAQIASWLRPYGIRVYLSANFGSPKGLHQLHTADPLDPQVQDWWNRKAAEIYQLIPDFGGFLVKANSEKQPGPADYHRTHAEGANMLARALKPYGGIVIWRSFVYGANHKNEDRVMQAVSEFKPLDGQFADNVTLQSKNGPLDFQPREPYAPIFDQLHHTPQMVELQITQEYTGQSRQLVYLAPMWKEFFRFVSPDRLNGIAGVANIGRDSNWCGHPFSQANWYAFGRLAWNPSLSADSIAREWLRLTFTEQPAFVDTMAKLMDGSREDCVNYMMPIGLHHIFRFDHHLGPDPGGYRAGYPREWCPVYYHNANKDSIGFDRSSHGTNAVSQYAEPYRSLYDRLDSCPDAYLLWFHRVPWTYRTHEGITVWESLQRHYDEGVKAVEGYQHTWQQMRPYVDAERWQQVSTLLQTQLKDAQEWRKVCLTYFGQFADSK